MRACTGWMLSGLLALQLTAAWAQEGRAPVITAPPPPEELTLGEELTPRVTIVERTWATIEEYSVNGRVYAVKITPAIGPAYYLYDADGDGELGTRIEAVGGAPDINQWRIIEW
ncbi:MAG: DUF2782 domain-containing protein [Aquisalimonadaceae bacterium]